MVRIALYFFSLIFSVSALSLEHVSASIDANPVIQGESFILEIVADDEVSISAFDSSSLLQDFIVGRTSTTTGTRMVNGSTTRETRWSTVLVPKKLGKIIIPAFDIENKKTAPIAVVVIEPSNKEAQQQRDIYITSEISSKEVYVQQQLTLKIKLYVGV